MAEHEGVLDAKTHQELLHVGRREIGRADRAAIRELATQSAVGKDPVASGCRRYRFGGGDQRVQQGAGPAELAQDHHQPRRLLGALVVEDIPGENQVEGPWLF